MRVSTVTIVDKYNIKSIIYVTSEQQRRHLLKKLKESNPNAKAIY